MKRPSTSGVVVVGGGIAGQALVEALRERDPDVAISLLCGEPRLPYDRVRLSEILVSGEDPDSLALRPAEWFEDHRVRVVLGARAVGLAAGSNGTRALELEGGPALPFDSLVLATGSVPLLPPLPGIDLLGVHPFRGPEDCEAIRPAAAGARRAVVIGGGLLGLEAARGVHAQGCPTTVVHLMDRLMERQLDGGAAGLLLPAFEELGIEVLLERSTQALVGDEDGVKRLRFADGEEIAADLVVVSIGIRPELTLARALGVECARGVVVDDAMRTSIDGVLALGECAEHRGVVYGLVGPIIEQARVAADTLLHREAAYGGSVPSAKLKVAGIDLVSVGQAEGDSAAIVHDACAGVYRKLVVSEGRATGAVLLGNTRGAEALLALVKAGEVVEDPLARLAAAAEVGGAELPAEAQVCNCNGVCKQTLLDAVGEGCATPREVMARTRAGTGCGSCKGLVVEIVADATGGLSDEPAYLCPCRKQTREQLAAAIRRDGHESASDVATSCGTGRECGVCKPALAYLISEVRANSHREERDARFINDRVHANIQRDGTFSVVPRIHGGVVTPAQLRRIAEVAERYEVPMVKVTGGQRLDLLGVRKQDLPAIWSELDMPSGHAYSKAIRTVKTCVGTDFCRYGLGDSIRLGIEMELAWEGLHTPHKVKSGVSGCPRNCAEASVKDIGAIAVEGGWQVRVGGAAGGTVREGDVLATVQTPAEALRLATAFLQFYREHAEYKERTYDFVPRVGLEQVREAVLDPQRSAELLERFRIAKAAALVDPWLERDDPYHPRQFTDLDEPSEELDLRELAAVGPPAGAER
ncbi:MAG: nitrite reductase large subunit [Solirubrobacterales bacterium]|nr:MAG: nitrite reductase large subunit [Solirubrobacterales bacterium]